MGDLKKHKPDFAVTPDEDNEIIIETTEGQGEFEEQTIERLRAYMKLFYEKQLEKKKNGDKEGE